jgi:alpha-tubulin suppressor-like RCC1 family protein
MWGSSQNGALAGASNLNDIQEIAVNGWSNVVLRGDGTVACWGAGLQDPSVLAQSTGVKSVGAARYSVFLVKGDGSIESFGNNTYGEHPTAVRVSDMSRVAAGFQHAIALRGNGTVFGWGSNSIGAATPPAGLASVVAISAGGQQSVALTSAGAVVCWGTASPPPAGLGPVASVAAGSYHIVAGLRDGTVRCWGNGSDGSASPPAGISGVRDVFAGNNLSFAVRTDGTVIGWGDNRWGQCLGRDALGYPILGTPAGQSIQVGGVELRSVRKVDAFWANVIACTQQGTIAVWGNSNGVVWNAPTTLTDVIDVGCGQSHAAVLRSNGTVLAWGGWDANMFGQINVPPGLAGVSSLETSQFTNFVTLSAADSSCSGSQSSGVANLAGSGGIWGEAASWNWPAGGVRVPGAAATANLGTYGSVGADCDGEAGELQVGSGATLLLTPAATVAGNDFSIRVTNAATLAGRLWLLGVSGGGATLPLDLDIPVLSAGSVNGTFDLIQTEVPPPEGKFLTLVPSSGLTGGGTLLSMRLLDIQTSGSLAGSTSGSYSGNAVAAATVDLNQDGYDDLALAVDFGASQPGLIQVLMNDGAGNLGSTSVLETTPAQPTCIAAGDVDGDGRPDLVVGLASDSTARVYRRNPANPLDLVPGTVLSGFTGSPRSVLVVPPPQGMLVAKSSRVKPKSMPSGNNVAVGTSAAKLYFYSNAGVQAQAFLNLSGSVEVMAKGGNLDGVQGTDIGTGGIRSNTVDGLLATETGFVSVVTDEGSGYAVRQTMNITANPRGMDVADIDGDGLDDLVTANAEPQLPAVGSALPVLSIFRNRPTGFTGGVPFQPPGASSGLDVSLIDVDSDGDRDIVSVHRKVSTDSEAALLRVDTLGAGTPISIGQTTVLDASDPILSKRGNLDGVGGEDVFLVVQPASGSLTSFTESNPFVKPYLSQQDARPGDLDGSGTIDAGDIAVLLLRFGTADAAADLDGSGVVDAGDIGVLLLLFG